MLLILYLIVLNNSISLANPTPDINNQLCQEEVKNKEVKEHFFVKIVGHYDEPESINNDNTIVLEGLSTDEYIEIMVKGKILGFEHIMLEWDNGMNDLCQKRVINSIDVLKNQIVIIKTSIPEGIPMEKIKWESTEGKKYEFIIQENGAGENVWEFNMSSDGNK